VLLCSGGAYLILQHAIVAHGHNQRLRAALGKDWKGKASFALYLIAIPLAFVHTWIAHAIYVAVAAMWLVPDRRIERRIEHA
jgi:hypothetical protein